jgi:hypothetical protein
MSIDNRTDINDCEDDNQTFATTGGALGTNTAAGNLFEGAASVQVLHSNVYDDTYTTTDSGGTSLNLNLSDATVYMLIKDDGVDTDSVAGMQIVLGDGTDRIGYTTGGSDATGVPIRRQFYSLKLDGSDAAANPGTADVDHHVFAGVEANLDFTAVSVAGYGSLHSAKALGNVANTWIDAMCYIANDSYALTINGGTSGTPETMADVVADDEGGLLTGLGYGGLVGNPLGSLYFFVGPTEWGNPSTVADHYFTADGEQWFWVGDNQGGRALGSTHFPFRLTSNATDTGSWVVTNTSIVNTGTRAQFLMNDADFETIEMDGCSFTGLDTIGLPTASGTHFTTNVIFTDCGQVTNNGADMTGSSVLVSNVAADTGALLYNETGDPDGTLDNMTFSMGGNNHHAIDFGTSVTSDITLRNMEFAGFGTVEDGNDAALRFLAASGTLNCNLVGCTVDGATATDANLFKDDAAGITVTLVFDPVTVTVHADDENGDDLQNARVYLKAFDGTGPMPYQDSVTIARSGTVATVTHTAHGMETGDIVKIEGITNTLNKKDNNGTHAITFIDANSYSYVTLDEGDTVYTGTIISTWVALQELTDVNGDAIMTKTFAADQPVDGFVRMSSSSPRYKTFDISGTISSTTGLTINVRMVLDE